MVAEGISIGIGASTGALLIKELFSWLRARYTKTEIPQPLSVHEQHDCVSVKECNRRMKDFDERLSNLERRFTVGFDNILAKLDAMDRKSEERAIACNRRLDPIVQKTSEIAGKVELIERKVFKIS